jgi:hypothetical protein
VSSLSGAADSEDCGSCGFCGVRWEVWVSSLSGAAEDCSSFPPLSVKTSGPARPAMLAGCAGASVRSAATMLSARRHVAAARPSDGVPSIIKRLLGVADAARGGGQPHVWPTG